MDRKDEIQKAYQSLGNEATFYDGMMTCSTFLGKMICKVVWDMNKDKNMEYIEKALSGIPKDFEGKMLEVPVGTGVLSLPIYKTLTNANITCLDYSNEMMEMAKKRCQTLNIDHVDFIQGDVGNLPFEDESFDLVCSLNGFHAFPNKEKAYKEIFRVLKPKGTFCGCFYVENENKRTDFIIKHLYVPKGFFTPPFETKNSLTNRLNEMYKEVNIDSVESIVCFTCKK